MLPVKWMPPEAFLDGIFTAKVKRSFLNDKDPFSLWCLCCLLLVQSLFLGGPTPYGVEYNFSMVELFFIYGQIVISQWHPHSKGTIRSMDTKEDISFPFVLLQYDMMRMRSLFIFILYLLSGNHCATLCDDAQSSCGANPRSLIFIKCTHKLVLVGNMIL